MREPIVMLSRAASAQETHHIRTVRFQTDEAAASNLKGVNLSLDMWVIWAPQLRPNGDYWKRTRRRYTKCSGLKPILKMSANRGTFFLPCDFRFQLGTQFLNSRIVLLKNLFRKTLQLICGVWLMCKKSNTPLRK